MLEQPPHGVTGATLPRRRFLLALGAGGAGVLAACQSSVPSAPAPPAAQAPAPVSPAELAPGPPGWEAEWNALVDAAQREGRLVLSGPPTAEVRTQVPAAFKRRFGIDVEYLGGRTGDLMTRLHAERAAGQYTVDAMIAGATSLYYQGYPEGMFDPLPPVLIHPEATAPARWIRGAPWYMDPEQQYILRLSNQVTMLVAVNTQFVPASEIRSFQDLLDPRYRGKISAFDPGVSGPGSANAAYLLHVFGEDYVRALYQDQQAGISREDRQLSDWLARGVHPICVGLGANEVEILRADGFPVAVVLHDLRDAPRMVSAGFGLTVLVNGAPHPNAARLFVNWVAMQEGNETYNRAQVGASVRTDVDNAWAPDYIVPRPGESYVDSYEWDWMQQSRGPQQLERLRQLTGR